MQQAGHLLKNIIRVDVETIIVTPKVEKMDSGIKEVEGLEEKPSQFVRAYTNVQSNADGKRVYMPTVVVMSDDDLRQKALDDALRDIRNFVAKYRALVNLVPIFEAIIAELKTNETGCDSGNKSGEDTKS